MFRQTAAVLALTGLAAVWGAAVMTERARPDAVLAKNYGSALADAETVWTSLPSNLWLSSLGGGRAAETVLAVGDTITIAGKDGPQVIEITGLELIEGEHLGIPGARFQLVSGRPRGDAQASLMRFIFASEAPHLTNSPARSPARAL